MKQAVNLIFLILLISCSSDDLDSSNDDNSSSFSDWKQYRGGNSRTGFSSSPAPSETPIDLNDGIFLGNVLGEDVTGSPLIMNGRIFITTGGWSFSKLSCFNLNDGSRIWEYNLNSYGDIRPPLIQNNSIFFVDRNEVIALNINDGTVQWRTSVSVRGSSPAYQNGILLVDNAALDANTGQVLWQFDGSENASPNAVYTEAGSYGPSMSNNLVYLSGYEQFDNSLTNEFLFAINIETGEEVWRKQFEKLGYLSWIIPISNNTLFFTTNDGGGGSYYRYALNATTGEEIWRFEMTNLSAVESSPAIGYNKVFIVTYNSVLTSFDQTTGQKLWEFDLQDIGANANNPVVADNKVFIAGRDFLYAVDINNGTELWKAPVYGALFGTEPVISGGKVIFNNGISLSILE